MYVQRVAECLPSHVCQLYTQQVRRAVHDEAFFFFFSFSFCMALLFVMSFTTALLLALPCMQIQFFLSLHLSFFNALLCTSLLLSFSSFSLSFLPSSLFQHPRRCRMMTSVVSSSFYSSIKRSLPRLSIPSSSSSSWCWFLFSSESLVAWTCYREEKKKRGFVRRERSGREKEEEEDR